MWQDIQTCLATPFTYGQFERSVSTTRQVIFLLFDYSEFLGPFPLLFVFPVFLLKC